MYITPRGIVTPGTKYFCVLFNAQVNCHDDADNASPAAVQVTTNVESIRVRALGICFTLATYPHFSFLIYFENQTHSKKNHKILQRKFFVN